MLCGRVSWHPQPSASTHLIAILEFGTGIFAHLDHDTGSVAAKDKRPGSDQQARAAHIGVTGKVSGEKRRGRGRGNDKGHTLD